MKKYIKYITLILFLCLTVCASAQSNKKHNKKRPIASERKDSPKNVDRLDKDNHMEESGGKPKTTTFDDQNVIDNQDYYEAEENPVTWSPYQADEDEDVPTIAGMPYSTQDDGAESEDEILMVIDSTVLHSPRADLSGMLEPVTIELENATTGARFVFPTPEIARTTSHFGPRRRRFHYGVDLAMPKGEPIYAAFDGVVRFSKFNRTYGNLIIIRHDNGLETYYAHLSQRHVTPGTRVTAGDIIGLCGNTGRSRGAHLHFEIRYEGNAMNPENVMSCETRSLLSPTLTLTQDSFRKVAKKGYSNSKGKGRSSNSNVGNYSADGKYYKVRSGDTLGRIAQRNGTTVRRLCQLNGIKETSILQIGQKIRLR